MLAILYAVQGFLPSLRGRLVALYSYNSTALAYLRKQGGTRSSSLNAVAQELLRLCKSQSVRLLPQFIPGHLSVLADSLRCCSQVLGSEWTLCPQAVEELLHRWPATIDLFDLPEPSPAGVLADVRPAGCGHRCHAAVVGWPPGLRLPTLRPPSSGVGGGLGLPGVGADAGGSVLASAPLVPGPSGAAAGDSLLPATKEGSSQTATFPPLPPEPVCASADCLSYIRRSARQAGFSEAVARQLTHCRRRSTRVKYQTKWVVYRSWCHRHGHSVSQPTVLRWLISSFISVAFYLFPTHLMLLTALCSSVSSVSFFLSSPLTSSLMTYFAFFVWSALFLPLAFLPGTSWSCSGFFEVLRLSLWLRPLCGPSPRRCSFWFPWLLLGVQESSRPCRGRFSFLPPMLTSLIFRSFGRRRILLSILFLAPFVSGR